jgi:Predicted metal-binding integral membrane protein (DUF2182)
VSARLARARLAHPEWWVYALAGCAWTSVVFTHLGSSSEAHGRHAHHGHVHNHPSAYVADDSATDAATFLLMVAAMMLPLVGPAARHAGTASFWRRRQRAVAWCVLGFAAVWAVVGLVLFALRAAVPLPGEEAAWLAGTAATAALWQGSRRRRRAAARCSIRPALPQRGWRATSRGLRAGAVFGARCIPLCGPAMAMMAVSPGIAVMVTAYGIQAYEWRRGPNPFAQRRWRAPAAAYAAMATLAAFVAAA